MQQSIENDQFVVSIRDKGAELCSLRSKKTGIEYIWQAHPEQWASHAPVLFPVIGASRPEGLRYRGQVYHLPRHGFVRENTQLRAHTQAHQVCYTLEHSPETLAVYPFEFIFRICFRLANNQLIVEHQIDNPAQDPLYFSLGAHPAFACPVHAHEQYADYYLEFETAETANTWLVAEGGLIARESRPFFDNTHRLPLDKELFRTDALVFKDLKSKWISLRSRRSDYHLRMHFADFPYMGIWARYGADFLCIEPWQGIADSVDSTGELEAKEGLVCLAPGQSYRASYRIELFE